MQAEDRFSLRLYVAFASLALVFVAASAFANWRSLAIEEETHALLTDALPSVEDLTAVIDSVRDVEASAHHYADLPAVQRQSARDEIDRRWQNIDSELATYLALPAFPGEHELYTEVPASLRELDGAIRRFFATVDAVSEVDARMAADREVQVTADRSARLLRHLVRFNATHAVDSAERIWKTRRWMGDAAAILSGAVLLFAFGVAAWLWRVFRSYASLQNAHAKALGQQAQELEVFGRRVAHDLLSPLSSLTFCLSAFKRVSEGDPKLENALVRARACVVRAQGLVDNVFDFARSGGVPNKDARADVREVVEQVVDEARAIDPGQGTEVTVGEIPECAVSCSRGVLASILGNLVRNSIKYMSDSAVKHVAIRVAEVGGGVRFEVEDTGPGVPPGLEAKIWEPYVRAEGATQPGLGLGLATVKRFCEAHGGSVGVRSVSGQGSVFYFTLPRAPESSAGALPPASVKLLRSSKS